MLTQTHSFNITHKKWHDTDDLVNMLQAFKATHRCQERQAEAKYKEQAVRKSSKQWVCKRRASREPSIKGT